MIRVLISAVFLLAVGCASPRPDCIEGPAEPVDCPGEPRPEGEFLQVPSATHPVVLHHFPDVPDEHVAAMLAQAERAFDLNAEWGMPALLPDTRGPDDAHDIYLVPGDELFGFARRDDTAPADGGCATFTSVNTGVDDLYELSVLQHEMRHAFQHAAWCGSGAVHEADASFAMDYALPELSLGLEDYVPAFQASPEESLFEGYHGETRAYGAMLFHRYLSERFGDGSPRLFGEALLELASVSDFFEAWSMPMQEQGETFESAMREFGWWRWVTPQLTSEHPWSSLGEPWPSETSIDPETLSFGEDFSGSLEPGGSTYRRVIPVLVAGSLTASLAPGPDLWLSAVRLASDGSWILNEANEQGVLELPLSPSVDVVLIVTYATTSFDFEDFLVDQPNAGQYSVTIEQD